MDKNEDLINAIDSCLPQTQCQLCGYAGCRPYAEAVVMKNEKIDRCLPGGVKTLHTLADILGQEAKAFVPEMMKKAKPPQIAVIRESECIGCTKCIQACPVDAIIGASKLMHTILAHACTGCELCIEPCPVNCIDLIPTTRDDSTQSALAENSRRRYQQRQERLSRQKNQEDAEHQMIKLNQKNSTLTLAARQAAIKAAVKRSLAKKK